MYVISTSIQISFERTPLELPILLANQGNPYLRLTTHSFGGSGRLHLGMQAPPWSWHSVPQMGDPHLYFPPKHERGKPRITCFTHTRNHACA